MQDQIRALEARRDELEAENARLTGTIEQLRGDLRATSLRLQAVTAENMALRHRAREYRSEAEGSRSELEVVPWRVVRTYWKLRPLIPKPLLRLAAATLRRHPGGRR